MAPQFAKLLRVLSQAPADQIHPSISPLFERLVDCDPEIVVTELKEIILKMRSNSGSASATALMLVEEALYIAELENKERSWHK